VSSVLGFINLNKPTGWTSHDCVAKVRRLLPTRRVGHGGTLDPAATGVLPIAVGKATRLLSFLPEKKAYRGKIRLGVQTTTDDLQGEIIRQQSASQLTLAEIAPQLAQFVGTIEQIPPAYSAIQRGGKRLYELARKGEAVEVPPRTVEIYQIDILDWYPGEFPELEVAIACGSGTYIRAIARDLGTRLQVGGTLAALERTESGGMAINGSITLETLDLQRQQPDFALIPPEIALRHLQLVILTEAESHRWCQGQGIPREQSATGVARVSSETGQFLGIGQLVERESDILLIPAIVLI
jgi:tRNA pseudouridine55 synthase